MKDDKMLEGAEKIAAAMFETVLLVTIVVVLLSIKLIFKGIEIEGVVGALFVSWGVLTVLGSIYGIKNIK